MIVALAVASASRWSRPPPRLAYMPIAAPAIAPMDSSPRDPRGSDADSRGRFLAAAVSGCHGSAPTQWTSPPTKPSVTSSIKVTINRPLADVARALDPQSWSQCSKYFKKSYLAVDPGTGTGDPTPDTPVAPGTGYPSTPVVAGTPYPWRLFFEHYDCGTACSYKNLLDVRTWYDDVGHYQVRFELHRYLNGTQRIKVDGGGLEVAPVSSGTVLVTAWKTLEFDSVIATSVAAAVFKQPAATDALITLACCDVPSS